MWTRTHDRLFCQDPDPMAPDADLDGLNRNADASAADAQRTCPALSYSPRTGYPHSTRRRDGWVDDLRRIGRPGRLTPTRVSVPVSILSCQDEISGWCHSWVTIASRAILAFRKGAA
jgi:hypothetical protein